MAKNRSGAATRERILTAALAVAGSEGLEALTTRRVAQEAGVNLGLLHYYFESKEALVEETIGLYFGEMRAVIEASWAGGMSGKPEEILTQLFTSALDVATRRPAILFGLVSRTLESIKESLRKGEGPAQGLENLTVTPFGPLAEVQGLLFGRLKPLLASRLGSDEALVARRSVQLFASLLHPIIFTPFPRLVFGCDLGSEEARLDYVRAVVADALRPPEGSE